MAIWDFLGIVPPLRVWLFLSVKRFENFLQNEFEDLFPDFNEKSIFDSSFSYGAFQLVGHGSVTNDNCGRFRGFLGCLRVDLHDKVVDGVNYHGKVYIVPVFH